MKSYETLLKKFATDENIGDLITSLKREATLEAEEYYVNNGSYPSPRNLLDRLEFDLKVALITIKKEAKL